MGKFISAIFLLIAGLIAFYIVSAFVGAIESTGLTENLSETEIILFVHVLPAVFIFGTLVSIFLGVKRTIGRQPPEQ